MSDNEKAPIVAPEPAMDQAISAFRSVVVIVTAFALGRHWIEGDLATLITTAAGIVLPVVYSQLKTRHRAKQLVTIRDDPRVPPEVVK